MAASFILFQVFKVHHHFCHMSCENEEIWENGSYLTGNFLIRLADRGGWGHNSNREVRKEQLGSPPRR